MTERDDLYRLFARVERAAQRDHDDIVELKVRIEESRQAHAAVHARDHAQLIKDFQEQQRRLDVLNHAHEEARQKEAAFASKAEMKVAVDDLVRRIESLTGTLGITLPRETFDAFQNSHHAESVVRDDRIANLELQVQGLAQNTAGVSAGSQRVTAFVFSFLAAAGVIFGIVIALLNH